MGIIDHSFDADCAPERVWAVLSDLASVRHYNPLVASVTLANGPTAGVGAERSCKLKPRGHVVERVSRWEDGRALGIEVVDSTWPVAFMRWTTMLAPTSRGCRVTQRLEYRAKFGPAGWILDRVAMRRALRRNVGNVLEEMIRFAETDGLKRAGR